MILKLEAKLVINIDKLIINFIIFFQSIIGIFYSKKIFDNILFFLKKN